MIRESAMSTSRYRSIVRHTVFAALFLGAMTAQTPRAGAETGFKSWVSSFRGVAVGAGVRGSTFDLAFSGFNGPDLVVLEKARYQPEFTSPPWDYFDNRVNDQSIAKGREMARKHKGTLDAIERRFGVDRHILLAIWSMESNYGEILVRPDVMRNTVQALATLAWGDKKRAKYARTQLIAALKILQNGDIDVGHLTGSWAGAMGHTQFIPTSYQAYAVDMDGNGKRDIWNSVPDALATAANLLKKNGWQSGHTWGYEVRLSAGKFPNGAQTISAWSKAGLRRANGREFPRGGDKAVLKVPDGRGGPAFLVTNNFNVLKRYNNADKYALAVGLLADAIAGGSMTADWKRPFTRLSFEERQELQKRLASAGFYDGKFDGKIGDGSKKAIMAFQGSVGLTKDGYPSMEVLKVLRKR